MLLTKNSYISPFLIKEDKYKARIEAFQARIIIAPEPIRNDNRKERPITRRLFSIIIPKMSDATNEPELLPIDVTLAISFS